MSKEDLCPNSESFPCTVLLADPDEKCPDFSFGWGFTDGVSAGSVFLLLLECQVAWELISKKTRALSLFCPISLHLFYFHWYILFSNLDPKLIWRWFVCTLRSVWGLRDWKSLSPLVPVILDRGEVCPFQTDKPPLLLFLNPIQISVAYYSPFASQ